MPEFERACESGSRLLKLQWTSMRAADTFAEGLFTLTRLGDFAPANHRLRVLHTMVNKVLAEMGDLFAQVYEASRCESASSSNRAFAGPSSLARPSM